MPQKKFGFKQGVLSSDPRPWSKSIRSAQTAEEGKKGEPAPATKLKVCSSFCCGFIFGGGLFSQSNGIVLSVWQELYDSVRLQIEEQVCAMMEHTAPHLDPGTSLKVGLAELHLPDTSQRLGNYSTFFLRDSGDCVFFGTLPSETWFRNIKPLRC
jgi:hypothetical protein